MFWAWTTRCPVWAFLRQKTWSGVKLYNSKQETFSISSVLYESRNFAQYDGFGSLLSAPSARAFGDVS